MVCGDRITEINYIFFKCCFARRGPNHACRPEEVSSKSTSGVPAPPKIVFRRERNKFRSSPPHCFVETGNRWFPFFPQNAGRYPLATFYVLRVCPWSIK